MCFNLHFLFSFSLSYYFIILCTGVAKKISLIDMWMSNDNKISWILNLESWISFLAAVSEQKLKEKFTQKHIIQSSYAHLPIENCVKFLSPRNFFFLRVPQLNNAAAVSWTAEVHGDLFKIIHKNDQNKT